MAGAASARPLGVTILAVLAFIGGILSIIGSLGIVLGGAIISTVSGPLGAFFFIFGLATLVIAVVELVLGYGFWTLKPWAWQLGFVLMAINVIVSVLSVLSGAGILGLLESIVIAAIIAYYLNTPEVRRAFAAPETGFPVVGDTLDQYLPGNRSGS